MFYKVKADTFQTEFNFDKIDWSNLLGCISVNLLKYHLIFETNNNTQQKKKKEINQTESTQVFYLSCHFNVKFYNQCKSVSSYSTST